MIINLSKTKTEALLLLCKDIISSYKDKEIDIFCIDKEIKEFMNIVSSDMLKQLSNVTRDNEFYIKNKNSYRINAILNAYNFLNKELTNEFKDGVEFNPSMLYFSMLAMWFKELGKESKSKEYIFFLLYPYGKVYDKLLLKIEDEKFKNLNIKMIEIAERIILKYDRVSLK